MTTIANIQNVQEVIAQVWSDESLKTKLLNNPKSVFADYGIEFPYSVEVQVHENTSSLMNYVLPQAGEIPEGVDLEEIEPVAGKVMKLALADAAFKTLLLSDPKTAVAEATGLTLPMSLEIGVYEDTPTVKHLVLPVNPASEELSDFELEAIAGGLSKAGGIGLGCAAAAGAIGTYGAGAAGVLSMGGAVPLAVAAGVATAFAGLVVGLTSAGVADNYAAAPEPTPSGNFHIPFGTMSRAGSFTHDRG